MNLIYKFQNWKDKVKEFFERGKKGYATVDIWNIDTWFLDTIIPMLKHFRKYHAGFPQDMENEEWEKILDEMIYCFENSTLDSIERKCNLEWEEYQKTTKDKSKTDKEIRQYREKWINKEKEEAKKAIENKDRGFELFSKYFYDLWD